MTRNPNPSVRKNILPGLQVPAGLPTELEKFLQGVKEHLQVLQGILGQPKERAVTLADLERIGLVKLGTKGGRSEIIELLAQGPSSEGGSSATQLSDLADVAAVRPGPDAVLVYNQTTGKWESADLSELAVFTDELAGLAPASGGGTDNFLRADGAWVTPPGGSGGGGALVYVDASAPAGNTVANTTIETELASTYTFVANSLTAGTVGRVRLHGTYGTNAAVAPGLRIRVKLGGQTVLDTALVRLATGESGAGWALDAVMAVTAVGATGTLEAQAVAEFGNNSLAVANSSAFTIDTTGPLALTITLQWDVADADNTATLREMLVYQDATATATDHGALGGLEDDDHPQYVLRSILTTDGDLFVRAGGAVARLAVGSEGQVLKVVSGAPAWAAESGGGAGTDDQTAAEVPYTNTDSWVTGTDVQAALDELSGELLVVDTFTDADGTEISAHTPDIDVVGGGWSVVSMFDGSGTPNTNDIEIQSNQLVVADTNIGAFIDCGETDIVVEFDWTTGTGDNRIDIGLRASDGDHYVGFNLREPQGDVSIQNRTTGDDTTFASAAFTFSDNTTYNIRLVLVLNVARIYIDGELIVQGVTSHQAGATGVLLGAATISTSQKFDNLVVRRWPLPF